MTPSRIGIRRERLERPRTQLAVAASLVLLIAAAIASVAIVRDGDTDVSQPRSARVTATTDGGSRGDFNDLPFVEEKGAITAQVTGGAPGRFELSIQIDKGTRDGVQRDMAVVNEKGLVGRIDLAASSQSSVVLLRDEESSVRVVLANGTTGFVVGRGVGRRLRLTDINGLVQVKKGDIVMTAGDPGSAFPGGIPVGHVHSVVNPTGALQQDILVKPAVDFRRLSYVKVLTPAARSTTSFVRPRELVHVAVINATASPNVAVLKSNVLRGIGYQVLPPIENAEQGDAVHHRVQRRLQGRGQAPQG